MDRIINILSSIKARVPRTSSQIVLRDIYLRESGLVAEVNKSALESVRRLPGESTPLDAYLKPLVKIYRTQRFKDLFHMSLAEFLDLPRHVLKTLVEIAAEENMKRNEEMEELAKNFTSSED